MIEENFDLLQAGKNWTVASPKRIHSTRACLHCGWTAQGARQIFVNHIIGESGKGRRNICDDVPQDVVLLFKNASSPKAAESLEVDIPVESGGGSSEHGYNIPAVDDKYLSTISDFDAEFWNRDAFIKQFHDCNRKSSLSVMALQRMYREFFNLHHDKWNSIKKRYEQKAIPQEVYLLKMQTLNLKCNGNAKTYITDVKEMRKRFLQIAGDDMNKEKVLKVVKEIIFDKISNLIEEVSSNEFLEQVLTIHNAHW